ncbi:MAG: transcription antitermination factor NusB [Acidobacteriota bacterium]
MGKRRTAREMAVRMLYQCDLGGSALPQVFSNFDLGEFLADPKAKAAADAESRGRRVKDAFEYAQDLVRGTVEHRVEIDELIRQQADNWRLERMPAVDRNILRLAVFEMLYEIEVPKLVVVDEAIELAKKYGSEHSGRFVNGLLDGLIKRHKFPGTLK